MIEQIIYAVFFVYIANAQFNFSIHRNKDYNVAFFAGIFGGLMEIGIAVFLRWLISPTAAYVFMVVSIILNVKSERKRVNGTKDKEPQED